MVDILTIEPFQFIRSTAFSERVQLANKLNEVIDTLNQIGTIDDLQTQIDAINSEISQIQTDIGDTNSDVLTLSNQVNTLVSEVNGLLKEVVSEVVLDAPEYGQVRVKVIHEDETETASNALQIPVIVDGGISLISGTTSRSFKIRYITADGVTHTTNDFVIPEGGGGTDVTVTSVSILEGDTDNSFKFEIGLSDGSSIQSNSYPFPAASELTPASTSQLGGIKVGTHLSVTADGTLSVDMTTIGTAAIASTLMWTANASKVTLHADSLAGTEFTEDIPQAAQGGAGTIDQASYAKIAANESAISELEADVAALAPTVSVNESADPPTITVGINGKTAQANLPTPGGWNPTLITDKTITDMIQVSGGTPIATAVIPEDFIIQYGVTKTGWSSLGSVLIQKGTYQLGTNANDFRMGVMMFGQEATVGDSKKTFLRCAAIKIQVNSITVGIWDEYGIDQLSLNTDETPPLIPDVGGWYRLFRLS